MLFNSIEFLLFLPVCFIVYWFVLNRNLKLQNIFILIASYVFYGWWDYRFLGLIILSTILDYSIGLQLSKSDSCRIRKGLVVTSLFINLGLLAFFKYYNFFMDSWVTSWSTLGIEMHRSTLSIILPVGISFYTFQTLSYTIDVYRKKLKATDSLIDFGAFVAFFPQLVAGPIERATNLLPQFSRMRSFSFENGKSGLYLIVWGLFKKVVIADNCAFFVTQIFENHSSYSFMELWLGAVLFAFQIYGDFSGYSDIAIGTARLFGFDLMTNFKFPYLSKNIGDFWRRWHISLSTWFRDYLYIPLGGSKGSRWEQLRNVTVIFLVSGFWHGANWTFLIWGAFHALLFIPLLLTKKNRRDINSIGISIQDIPRIITTFMLVTIAWIYFRAETIHIGNTYIQSLFSFTEFEISLFTSTSKNLLFFIICVSSIIGLLFIETRAYLKSYTEVLFNKYEIVILIACILLMGSFKNATDFIYFQF